MSQTSAETPSSETVFAEPKSVCRTFKVDLYEGYAPTPQQIESIAQKVLGEVHDSLSLNRMHFPGKPLKPRLVVEVVTTAYQLPDEIEDTIANREAFQSAVEQVTPGTTIGITYFSQEPTSE